MFCDMEQLNIYDTDTLINNDTDTLINNNTDTLINNDTDTLINNDIDLEQLNKNLLIDSIKSYMKIEKKGKITNIKNSTFQNLREIIYKYNINIKILYYNYYIELLDEYNAKKIIRKNYLLSYDRLEYNYNQKITTLLLYYENSKNRHNINNDTTEEQNNYLKKIQYYKNKLNKLQNKK